MFFVAKKKFGAKNREDSSSLRVNHQQPKTERKRVVSTKIIMDNVNWNSNSSDKLQIDEEKQRLLTQLQDMFPLIPQGIIIQIAEENYWQRK